MRKKETEQHKEYQKPRTEKHMIVVERCAERDCVWNYVHWKNGEKFPCGCCMQKVICDGRFKISVEEAKKEGLI